MRRSRLGPAGEQLAAEYLERTGWQILHRNYRSGRNEIDIIAQRGDTVAFVEVKTRSGNRFGHPLDAIDERKREEITRVAAAWLAGYSKVDLVYRFDAIAIEGTGASLRIQHVENAWGM